MASRVDYLFFFCGLSFFLLAAMLCGLRRRGDTPLPWQWLMGFALLHGLGAWLHLLAVALGDTPYFFTIRLAVIAAAFTCLAEFGQRGMAILTGRSRNPWITPLLLILAALSGWGGWAGVLAGIHYALGLTGGVWTAWALWRYRDTLRFGRIALSIAAAGIALYTFTAHELFIPITSLYFSAPASGSEGFPGLAVLPLQAGRGLMITAIALAFGRLTAVSCGSGDHEPRRLMEVLLLPLLAVAVLLGGGMADWVEVTTQREQADQLIGLSRTGAAAVNERMVQELSGTGADLTHTSYLRLKEQLMRLRAVAKEICTYYILRLRGEQVIFLVDSESPGAPKESLPGQVYERTTPSLVEVFKTGHYAIEGPLTNPWQTWFSGMVPLLDDSGHIIAVMGVDIAPTQWLALVARNRLNVILLVALLSLLLLFLFVSQCRNREALAALREEEQRLSKIASQIPGVVYQFKRFADGRSCVPYASEAVRWIFRLEPEAIRADASPLFALIHPDDLKRVEQLILESARSLRQWKCEFRIVFPDGMVAWRHGNSIPQREPDGSVLWHGFITDISEQKQIEAALDQARKDAETANRAKSNFLANMSHEIRTPMNGILGMTDLLVATNLTAEQRRYARLVRTSAEALLTIINEILDFSKIEAGKLELEVVDFDPPATLEDAVEMLAVRSQEKDLELVCFIEPQIPERLRGDPGRLRQILINLIGNAVKFTDRGEVVTRVKLAAEVGDHITLAFEVTDTGVGIPADRLPLLFFPFAQVDGSATRRYGGTGLGLVIAKRLAELMDGQIGVESVKGQGSKFWFTATFERSAIPVAVLTREKSPLSGLKVLIVDDHPTNRQLVATLLATWGCRYAEARHAEDALAKLQVAADAKDPFAVVLLDMKMPEVDSVDWCQQIKTHPAIQQAKLIMMVPLGCCVNDTAELGRFGVSACLTKPLRQSQLRTCLELMTSAAYRPEELISIRRGNQRLSAESSEYLIHILLAEDNAINQEVALAILGNAGYRIDVANNGLEAIAALQRRSYDLVLMDCQMPEMDGYEATRKIREAGTKVGWPQVPIIAMTANAMKGDREKCLAAGMNDYVAKPVQAHELVEVIERWLGRNRNG